MKDAIGHMLKLFTSQRFGIVAGAVVLMILFRDKFFMACVTAIAIVLILCYTWKETQSTAQAVKDLNRLKNGD